MVDEEKLASLSEVKDLLEKDEKEGNITYEKRLALEHAKQFTILDKKKSNNLIQKLLHLERVSESLAYKIAELLPQYPDEVRPIFAKERFTLEEDEIKQIIEIVKNYV
ncbi:RNA polymerase Rpb4 family protein [[Eubacterium] cellulosolvens]